MRKTCIIFSLLLIALANVNAQYSINDENNTLSKKERVLLDLVIGEQIVFFQKIIPDTIIAARDVKLNIYTDYGAYLLHQKEQMKTTYFRSMGFYSPKNKEAVVCKDKHDKGFMGTCYHELSHFFIHTYLPPIPIWINEGLAVYFGDAKVTPKGIKPQIVPRYTSRVQTMIDTRDIDLKDFMGWSTKQFQQKSFTHDSYGYALGYTILYFLMQKSEDLVVSLIQQVAKKKSCVEAFDEVYEGGFDQFEKDFFKHVGR